MSLIALVGHPFKMLTMRLFKMLMMRRVVGATGPKTDTRDFGSAALIFIIIGAAFLWIFAGLGLLGRVFR